jgi:hypothetical protein
MEKVLGCGEDMREGKDGETERSDIQAFIPLRNNVYKQRNKQEQRESPDH